MICVRLNGGLGNQMFQYACGRSLALKHKTELLLDTTWYSESTRNNIGTAREFEMFEVFPNLDATVANKKDLHKYKLPYYNTLNSLSNRLGFGNIQTSNYFIETSFSYNSKVNKISNKCYLMGYWQSQKYSEHNENIIRNDFQFRPLPNSKNISILDKIKATNSVSIHIRRTDYLNTNTHGVCSVEYYQKAVEYISKKIANSQFFIFSDDIPWVKKHLKFKDYPMKIISGNEGPNSFIDMSLMSNCKHNIIANSSFSWWGAWLNSNKKKIVIGPKRWFENDRMNAQTNDLFPKNWVRI